MGIVPPSVAELMRIARRYGLSLDDSALASFRDLMAPTLASYAEVERLYEERAPEPLRRGHTAPSPEGNPLNAWCVRTDLRTHSDGPLAGRTLVVKDNIAVGGVPMSNGSRALRGFVPRADATVITRVLDAGVRIIGKGACEDLGYSAGSHTGADGPVRNPWDPERSAGGSSSGPAVLVATGEADLALGGDQGGSLRVPAAFSGIVGHKPTHGLVPCTGAFPMENTLDHLGPMAATVTDVATLLGVLAGPDGLDPRQGSGAEPVDYLADLDSGVAGLRIGLLTEGFGLPGLSDPRVDEAVRAAAHRLGGVGADVREISVPWHTSGFDVWKVIATDGIAWQMIDGNGLARGVPGPMDPELVAHFGAGRAEHADSFSETVKLVVLNGAYTLGRYHGAHYAMARNLVPELIAGYDAALSEVDVLVLPTVPHVANPLPGKDSSRAEYVGAALGMVNNVAPLDASGHPATAVPAGLVDGLPVSMMIVGPRLRDDLCLRVARAHEVAMGGFPAPHRISSTARA
ncbi:amidase [Allokutzneria multivorans]|uniref:Amidase n=1 Tax=Allokutzneria multivorans TaxID=1142134 RepID=A0ABP7U681_9PSEU